MVCGSALFSNSEALFYNTFYINTSIVFYVIVVHSSTSCTKSFFLFFIFLHFTLIMVISWIFTLLWSDFINLTFFHNIILIPTDLKSRYDEEKSLRDVADQKLSKLNEQLQKEKQENDRLQTELV